MMNIILAHNHFDKNHLEAVVSDMEKLGAPEIRCYDPDYENFVFAIEGCHRLRACEILGIEPKLIFIEPDTKITELEDLDFDGGVESICEIGDYDNYTIKFDSI